MCEWPVVLPGCRRQGGTSSGEDLTAIIKWTQSLLALRYHCVLTILRDVSDKTLLTGGTWHPPCWARGVQAPRRLAGGSSGQAQCSGLALLSDWLGPTQCGDGNVFGGVKGHKEVKAAAQEAEACLEPSRASRRDGRERRRDEAPRVLVDGGKEFGFYYSHSGKLLEGSRQRKAVI